MLDLSGDAPVLLRPGGISTEELQDILGPLAVLEGGVLRSPGMLRRHYAPSRPVRLNARGVRPGEALLGFGPDSEPAALNLSPRGDLVETAANLFAMLRALDEAPGYTGIAVAPIPEVRARRSPSTTACAAPPHPETSHRRRAERAQRFPPNLPAQRRVSLSLHPPYEADAEGPLRSDVFERDKAANDQQREAGRHQRQVALDECTKRRSENPEQRGH